MNDMFGAFGNAPQASAAPGTTALLIPCFSDIQSVHFAIFIFF
jgi:hypothetical protein